MKAVVISLGLFIVQYLGMAFIVWQLNAAVWTEAQRFMTVFVWSGSVATINLILYVNGGDSHE